MRECNSEALTAIDVVTDLLRVIIVKLQQPALARHRLVNNNRGMVFSEPYVPMAAHATTKYVMQSLNNNCTATEER
jgi:hypothetical protein